MTNIKKSHILFAIILPLIIVFYCWNYIDNYSSSAVGMVNGASPENTKLKEIEVAGQFGDKFGFVTCIFTGLGFSFLLLNFMLTKRQIQIQQIEIRNSEISRSNDVKISIIKEMVDLQNTVKSSIIVSGIDWRPSDGTQFDVFVKRIGSDLSWKLNALENENDRKLYISNNLSKHNIDDMKRYFMTINQISKTIMSLDPPYVEIAKSLINCHLTKDEIEFIDYVKISQKFPELVYLESFKSMLS